MSARSAVTGAEHRLRARDIVRRILVWVVVPGVVHVAVILLLMHLQFLVARKAKKEAVIDTALEEIDIRDNPIEHLAPTNVKTSLTSNKKLDWKAMLQPDNRNVEKPDERDLVKMMEATEDQPLQLVKIAIPTDGLTSIGKMGATTESATSVAAVVDSLGREIAKMLTKRNVLLVWLFDESGSTRRSQKQVKGRITKLYAELQGSGGGREAKLVSAVVGYGKKTHLVLRTPSASAQQVQQAMDRVSIDTTGQENVMAACRDVMQRYGRVAKLQRRALVIFIVTDEIGNDLKHLEQVIALAKGSKTRVFVLGGEAVFQKKLRRMHGKSPGTNKIVPVLVEQGGETHYKEVLDGYNDGYGAYWLPWRTNSGFGFWALSRLAKETGGTYYVMHGEKGPSFDPDVMQPYAPELCSAREYKSRSKANRVRGTITHLHSLLAEVPLNGSIGAKNVGSGLRAAKNSAEKRIKRLDEIIRVLERGSLANAPTAAKRWEANRQLAVADAYALRWSARQFIHAVDDFRRRPKLSARAISYHCNSHPKNPVRGGAVGQKELAACRAKYQEVVAAHPGTPWAATAKHVRQFARYKVSPKFPPKGGGGSYKPPPPPPKL